MRRAASRRLVLPGLAFGGLALLGAAAGPIGGWAQATSPPVAFSAPVKLAGGCGGEPSIAVDVRSGHEYVYVSSPKGIEAGVASCDGLLSGTRGAATWASSDGAKSFGPKVSAGSATGGGDSDTQVDTATGAVYLADLEAIGSDVCVSKDHGATYLAYPSGAESCSANLPSPPENASNQTGFEADREWLTSFGPTPSYPHHDVYLTYHDFAFGVPLQWRSQDGGPFQPQAAPAMNDPAFAAAAANGTVMAKPVIDAEGDIYALVTTQAPANGSLNHLWLVKSTDHGATWTDTSIFAGAASAQLGLVFNDLAIDGAGNLYALALGNAAHAAPPVHAYLFHSTNQGATWSAPVDLNPGGKALALAAMHGGPKAGELVIGWYASTNTTDPNDLAGRWDYRALESTDATSATPAFSTTVLGTNSTAPHVHQGQICTQGILCTIGQLEGGGQGNRNLADFSSVTVDPAGCAIFTYADDGLIKSDQSNFASDLVSNDVVRQTSGCLPVS